MRPLLVTSNTRPSYIQEQVGRECKSCTGHGFPYLRIDFRMSDHVFSAEKIVPVISLIQSELYARTRGFDRNTPLTESSHDWNQLICRSLYGTLDEHSTLRKLRSSVSAMRNIAYGIGFRRRSVIITNGLCPRSTGRCTILTYRTAKSKIVD
jgi:hypothetical protein